MLGGLFLAALAFAIPARADLTTVYVTPQPGEVNLINVNEGASTTTKGTSTNGYALNSGGTIGAYDSTHNISIMDKLYGAGNYARVADYGSTGGAAGLANPLGVGGLDQQWYNTQGLTFDVTVKYAGNANTVGYYNLGGGGFVAAAAITGNGFWTAGGSVYINGSNAANANTFTITTGQTGSPFELGLKTTGSSTAYYSSNPTSSVTGSTAPSNAGEDHMVTFELGSTVGGVFTGNGTFVIAWEDVAFGSSDKDYNDAVLQFTVATPEPSTLAIAGIGALGFGVHAWRRRKAKKS
jgi:hypothetical protein